MRILVTGCSGLLGAHLMALLSRVHRVTGVDRHPWWGDQPARALQGELSSPEFLKAAVQEAQPEAVIHCAAMTDVESCERDPEAAYLANGAIPGRLACAVPRRCLFVQISTDAVFRGNAPLSSETQLRLPRTVYARSKVHGEWEVQIASDNHLILRTNFYGWSSGRKKTFGEWLYAALRAGESVTLFEDVFFTPIYVMDLAERIERLLALPHRGVLHLGGAERVSKARFGVRMAELAGFPLGNVHFGSLRESGLAVARALDTSLDSGRFSKLTGIPLPDCSAGLARFLAERELPLSQRAGAAPSLLKAEAP